MGEEEGVDGKPVEVEGGVSGHTELPAKLPSQVPAELTFRGLAGGEVTTSEPQDIPGLQTCSFPSEFTAGLTHQRRPHKVAGLQLLSTTWATGQHWAPTATWRQFHRSEKALGSSDQAWALEPVHRSFQLACLSFVYQLGVSKHWHLQFQVLK